MNIQISRLTAATIFLAFFSLPALAQLTIRLDPEVDDPGTSSMPARLGYANANGKSSGALQMALTYNFAPSMPQQNSIVEPYASLLVNDNPSIKTDKKALELGLHSTAGDISLGAAYLLEAAISKNVDRAAGTNGLDARVSGELVHKYLKYGLGHVKDKWGLFIRPKLGLYYVKTQETDDPVTAPLGSASGAWFEVAVDYFPSISDRAKISYTGKFAHDANTSGDRVKDNYRKHTLAAEYLLYNYANPPKGKPLFSLVLNRRVGADALEGQPIRKSSTGIYLGMKL